MHFAASRHIDTTLDQEHPPIRLAARTLFASALLVTFPSVTSPQEPLQAPPDLTPPGSVRAPDLNQRLRETLAQEIPQQPRTQHLQDDGAPRFANRLLLEDSPYLRQHAHNPVDWFPWGPEAFEKARLENKPVFLSIGYSTCHWCHVMEEESFDDLEVGRYLNQHFVAIKVDRETHPDIDTLYMTALQVQGQRGGWPMSSFLTPEAEPFFGATYFPRQQFLDLLTRVQAAWTDNRPQVIADARRLTDAIRRVTATANRAEALASGLAEKATSAIMRRYDEERGGFSPAPKFPNEPDIFLLLDHAERTGDESVWNAVSLTLERMARGGIYDQIGGGFHRYSTDAEWLVPHFEKMLYNQANLTRIYSRAWLLEKNPQRALLFERTVRDTLAYLLRDMESPEGGFYSATDADSKTATGEFEEGVFFTWTPEDLRSSLSTNDAELAAHAWGVEAGGNFEGRTILHLVRPLPETAARAQLEVTELLDRLSEIALILRRVRGRRPPPLRDDKILTVWNGMAITALAEAAEIFGEPRYEEAARRAAAYLWSRHRITEQAQGPGAPSAAAPPQGTGAEPQTVRLRRSSLAGRPGQAPAVLVPAVLDDYAAYAEGLLALYDTTGEPRWLERAQAVTEGMNELFRDPEGGYFITAADHRPDLAGPLLARPRSGRDGAEPSGASMAVRALARLATRSEAPGARHHAEAALASEAKSIEQYPAAYSYMLLAARELRAGETGHRTYTTNGKVRVTSQLERSSRGSVAQAVQIDIELDIAPGWHVTSNDPGVANLLPARVAAAEHWQVADLAWPEATVLRSEAMEAPVRAWVGHQNIRVTLESRTATLPTDSSRVHAKLALQVCNETICLPPENLSLAPRRKRRAPLHDPE